MEGRDSLSAARGITDAQDRLISADTPLALLQERCGGTLPGPLAIPELLEQVQHARRIGLRIARPFSAFDGEDMITGFVRIHPRNPGEGGAGAESGAESESGGGGCELLVESWQRSAAAFAGGHALAGYLDGIDRASAEIALRLDARQRIQTADVMCADGQEFAAAVALAPGSLWSDLAELQDASYRQPLHWRLLDGALCRIPGSQRTWRVRLIPVAERAAEREPAGFELLMIADEALADMPAANPGDDAAGTGPSRLFGRTLTPALRQPLARIIANAETIRARLAGPLHEDYCHYAATIASAGQHLSAMLDDLADLEVVEAAGFATIAEDVDLLDAAHKAVGILGVRAHDKQITLQVHSTAEHEAIIAQAEFRRVLQILINLIGNAIAYSPAGSTVRIAAGSSGEDQAALSVSDEGPGITAAQASRIFEKFERLGRDDAGGNDTGSGLGLYISRRLALAMNGDLAVTSAPGEGAEFTLTLPRAGAGAGAGEQA